MKKAFVKLFKFSSLTNKHLKIKIKKGIKKKTKKNWQLKKLKMHNTNRINISKYIIWDIISFSLFYRILVISDLFNSKFFGFDKQ